MAKTAASPVIKNRFFLIFQIGTYGKAEQQREGVAIIENRKKIKYQIVKTETHHLRKFLRWFTPGSSSGVELVKRCPGVRLQSASS